MSEEMPPEDPDMGNVVDFEEAKARKPKAKRSRRLWPEPWQEMLRKNTYGEALATLGNTAIVLEHELTWRGRLAFNEMTAMAELGGKPMTDEDYSEIRLTMEGKYGFSPSKDTTFDAVALHARKRAYHPVQAYLRGLTWDGLERFPDVVGRVLGAEPSELNVTMVRRWFIGAVARALKPGCKMDTALILQGAQGVKKSTFFETMGSPWFVDTPCDLGSKDVFQTIRSAWIYEFGEMQGFNRADRETVKGFMSSRVDNYRPPYARTNVAVPRSCVFAASTNEDVFLRDATGSRRFWVLSVGQRIDLVLAAELRDQLWAEAVHAFENGTRWWFDEQEKLSEERRERAERHEEQDVWAEAVLGWARGKGPFTSREVLEHAVGLKATEQNRAGEMRISDILKRAGYSRDQNPKTIGGMRIRQWHKAEAETATPPVDPGPPQGSLTYPSQGAQPS